MNDFSLKTATRVHDWWRPKASSLLSIIYLVMFISSLPFFRSLVLLVLSLVTMLGIGAFGHFINDWFDVEADQRAGKTNLFERLVLWQKLSLLFGALVVALLPWAFLPANSLSFCLLALEFLLFLMYSVPPLRLKERVHLAPLADAVYAYALPAVLATHTFFLAGTQIYDYVFISTVFLWQFALGVRHFLNHLALDRVNDLASHTRTLATTNGNYYLHSVISKVVLPIEVLCFSLFLINFSRHSVLLVAACVGLLLAYLGVPLILAVGRGYSILSHRFSHTPLDDFYQTFLPLVPLLFLISEDPRFLLLLALHLFLFHRHLLSATIMRRPSLNGIRYLMSAPGVLGFPLLLMKKAFEGENLKSEVIVRNNQVEPEPAISISSIKDPSLPNIAVVNVNKAKYTETFISELMPRLNYNVHFLHGGELPTHDHEDRQFLSKWPSVRVLAQVSEYIFRLDHKYFLENSIASYLQARRIRLVLAEFGPMGTRMLAISRDLGIPLVVVFHGYDVFHRQIWNAHVSEYKELFKYAERIVVVSELMRERLLASGAPTEKVVHLPAFVNLKMFPYKDRSTFPPRFIAVGRFAETKSPHLTILAFSKVADLIPEASLVMMGKDGGGNLFEACVILSRALRLEAKITFKGITSHAEVAEEMSRARGFIQHSVTTPENQDMEGKPVAIMEAMSGGVPVIATRHSGINELITHGIDGLLVDEYDVEAMSEAMLQLATNDSLVRDLGEAASSRIQNDPLISNHVNILETIIDECIHG